MMLKLFQKSWFHVLILAAMLFYLVYAPALVAMNSSKGKPLRIDVSMPAESDQISFAVEGVGVAPQGKNLWSLYGWAFILPQEELDADSFAREIILISNERKYFFSAESIARNPSMPGYFTDRGVDLETLGFHALIMQAAIKPGKYRIGIVFRNTSDGSAYYRDKPVFYLVKTPNTLRLERK